MMAKPTAKQARDDRIDRDAYRDQIEDLEAMNRSLLNEIIDEEGLMEALLEELSDAPCGQQVLEMLRALAGRGVTFAEYYAEILDGYVNGEREDED